MDGVATAGAGGLLGSAGKLAQRAINGGRAPAGRDDSTTRQAAEDGGVAATAASPKRPSSEPTGAATRGADAVGGAAERTTASNPTGSTDDAKTATSLLGRLAQRVGVPDGLELDAGDLLRRSGARGEEEIKAAVDNVERALTGRANGDDDDDDDEAPPLALDGSQPTGAADAAGQGAGAVTQPEWHGEPVAFAWQGKYFYRVEHERSIDLNDEAAVKKRVERAVIKHATEEEGIQNFAITDMPIRRVGPEDAALVAVNPNAYLISDVRGRDEHGQEHAFPVVLNREKRGADIVVAPPPSAGGVPVAGAADPTLGLTQAQQAVEQITSRVSYVDPRIRNW